MPEHLAEQENESLKSVCNLDFLGIMQLKLERKLENLLVGKIRDLLIELGYGFAFIGSKHSKGHNTTYRNQWRLGRASVIQHEKSF